MPTQTVKSSHTSAPSRATFRPELQGLRALAVGLVLLYHLWPDHVSGGFVGVDVFFVVSGFLITGHLYREISSTGTISLSKFWARRIMRLLPLAFAVLIFSLVVMLLFLPQTVWGMNIRQILGSLFYVENWVLAVDSVDYMAADNEPSLVQHYWSLSIEEQFYLVLPLLLLGAYLTIKFLQRRKQTTEVHVYKVFLWTLVAITILAFTFSVLYTNYNAAQAYFVTPTRFWEFSIGGLIAMMPAATRLPMRAQNLLGWAGIIFVVISAVVYTGDTAFPGYTALLPVAGAALFIRYGSAERIAGIYWWASLKPTLRLGDWSYAIYLWHWPLIIVANYRLEPFSWPYKIGLVFLTVLLSAASQKLIEDPLRHANPFKVPKRAFTLMASNIAIIAAATFFVPQMFSEETNQEIAIAECTGANALLNDCQDSGYDGNPLISATQVQLEQEEPTYPECNVPKGYTDFDRDDCSLGASEDTAEYTIALLGDSHARAWLPMLDDIGKQNNWNIQGYTKSACTPVPLSSAGPAADQAGREASDACQEFITDSSEEFEDDETIDAVITAASPTDKSFYDESGNSSDEIAINALDTMWQGWHEAGKNVIVIGEVPHFGELNAPTCVESNPDSIAEECSLPADEVVGDRGTILTSAADRSSSPASYYNPVPGVCDHDRCYSMVGKLITRYDHHHLSADFARSYGSNFVEFIREEAALSSD